MKEAETYLNTIDKVLEKEQDELLSSKREHHTSWDNHILTLSMAALGFAFSFLPFKNSECFFIFVIAILFFVFAIITTLTSYIKADKGLNFALESNRARKNQYTRIRNRMMKCQREVDSLSLETQIDFIVKERDACWKDVENILDEEDFDAILKKIQATNKVIIILNHAKTYFFIFGVLMVVIFSFVNINKFN